MFKYSYFIAHFILIDYRCGQSAQLSPRKPIEQESSFSSSYKQLED